MKSFFSVSALLLCSALLGAGPAFVRLPAVEDLGPSASISFAVSEFTDVTVEVVDTAGAVIRHLGTGLLGANPPSPFIPDSLAQTILWNKKDDAGNDWTGPFDVRVGLGIKAGWDRFYGWNGDYTHRYTTRGLAVDTAGNLIIMDWCGTNRGFGQTSMYDRTGKYIRTLIPYPNNLPEERLKGFGRQAVHGKKGPVFYLGFHGCPVPEYFNPFRQGMTVSPQGWLVMMNSVGNGMWYGPQAQKTRLLIVGLDGSCPRDTVYGPILLDVKGSGGQVAVTADGKSVYATGVREGYSTLAHTQVVFKSPLDDTGQAAVFKGRYGVAGGGDSLLSAPKGVAVDRSGNVYVSDSGNSRIAVYDSTGAYITECAFNGPDHLQMNMKTGELYVLSYPAQSQVQVSRLSPLPEFKVNTARLMATANYFTNYPVMALDWHSAIPRIWVAGYSVYFVLDDTGDSLVPNSVRTLKTMPDRSDPAESEWPWLFAVDPKEEVLFAGCVNWTRIDLASGTMTKAAAMRGRDIAPGIDGTFYTWGKSNYMDSTVLRYDKMGVQIAHEGGAMDFHTSCSTFFRGPEMGGRGFCQAPSGDLYFMRSWRTGQAVVDVHDRSGARKRDSVIVAPVEASGIQVDRGGNLFMTLNVRPKANSYPSYLERPSEFLPDPWTASPYKLSWPYALMNYYLYLIGSLFKFPSTGGTILPTTDPYSTEALSAAHIPPVQINGGYDRARRITGALWQYLGVGLCPASSGNVAAFHGDNVCRCHGTRFTVDPNGRIVFADPMSSTVGILDQNRNEILRFGEYGNADQQGPVITFQFPNFVQAVNQSVYVSDPGSRRITRVKLIYTVQANTHGVISSDERSGPARFATGLRVFPVPCNSTINVEWTQDAPGTVNLTVHSPDGRLVSRLLSGKQTGGHHRFAWNGRDRRGTRVGAGVYFLRLERDGKIVHQRVIIAG